MQDNKQIVLVLSVNESCIVAVITTTERFYDILTFRFVHYLLHDLYRMDKDCIV